MRHLVDIKDFSVDEIYELLEVAEDIMQNEKKYEESAKGKILATLFFEPSTRTRLSFESAMYKLGGNVLTLSNVGSSSEKGESTSDTVRTVGCYSDIIAMRHPNEGTQLSCIPQSSVPIINAGDGKHAHPTQTLTDLLTIKHSVGRLENMSIGLCGDLKYGRTVHSIIIAMARHSNIKFVLISPKELKCPNGVIKIAEEQGVKFEYEENLAKAMPKLDVLYMTRVQGERFEDKDEFLRLRDSFILDNEKLINAKESLVIMHPLPRVNEIAIEVDSDPRACYFKQVENGKFVRMALILKLLKEIDMDSNIDCTGELTTHICKNKGCVTNVDNRTVRRSFTKSDGTKKCLYCESGFEA